MEDKAKIAEKIRKILNKATEDNYAGEAEAALLKAQELLLKHGMTMDDIQVSGTSKEVVTEAAHDWTKSPWWYGRLGMILGDNFRCYVYIDNGRRYSNSVTSKTHAVNRVVFMGLKDDVETCKACFQYAMLYIQYQTQRIRRKVRKQGRDTGGVANDYIMGFLQGLRDKFKEQVETNSWALVLVKDPAVTEEYNKLPLVDKKVKAGERRFDAEAYNTGYQHGKNFDKPAGFIKEGGE